MKKHIPNIITCCNLICGCIATYSAFHHSYQDAFFFILLGALFDFFDGKMARALGVSGKLGLELDSLADDVTFGVAPSAIVFSELFTLQYPVLQGLQTYIPYCAFLIAAFSALRLAKFNLDDRQTTSFIGLPTPANALFWGSFIIGGHTFIESFRWGVPLILIMICLSCYLLVAEFPMFALKFKKWSWKGNEVKYIFILSCIPMLLFLGYSAFSAIIAWYVILSAIVILVNKSKKAS